MEGITPLQVADAHWKRTRRPALKLVAELRPSQVNKELRLTLGDYEAMAHLGNYYAEKIRGATAIGALRRHGRARAQAGGHRAPDDGARPLEALCGRGHRAVQAAVAQSGRQCGFERADGESLAGYRDRRRVAARSAHGRKVRWCLCRRVAAITRGMPARSGTTRTSSPIRPAGLARDPGW